MPAICEDDAQLWLAAGSTGNLSDQVALMVDGSVRIRDGWTYFGHFQLRAGLGWRLTRDATLFAGYSFVHSGTADTPMTDEHRLYQQLSFPIHKSDGWSLGARTRLEQRWRSDGDDMALRVRQQLKLGIPLDGPDSVQLVVHSEVLTLLTDSDWGGEARVDQLRSFAGVAVPLSESLKLEAGYLNINQFRIGDDLDAHAASLSIAHRF